MLTAHLVLKAYVLAFSSHQVYLQVRISKTITDKSNIYGIQVLTTSISLWQLNQTLFQSFCEKCSGEAHYFLNLEILHLKNRPKNLKL